MRLTYIFSLLLVFFADLCFAQTEDQVVVSGEYAQVPVGQILNDLQHRYPVRFFSKNEWLPDQPVTFSFFNESLYDVLDKILSSVELNYMVYGSAVIVAPERLISREYSREYFLAKKRQEELLQSRKWSAGDDVIAVGDSNRVSQGMVFLVEGHLIDRLTGEALQGVNLHFEVLNKTAFTGGNGNFRIELPEGLNPVEISYVGYESRKALLRVFSGGEIIIELTPDAKELDEILITGEAADDNTQSAVLGVTRLKPRQIRELPVFLGEADVIKSLMTLPGVSMVGEGAGGFNVRGGSIDQNLILQDEAMIFNSSHALGFFSVFNPDAIRDVTFYKSHIPAQYGGRLSSVLNVQLKGEEAEKFNMNGGIGFVASRLVMNGPLRFRKPENQKAAKTTFLLGGRIAYSDWILQIINDPQINNSSASFYDLNLKLSHRYSDRGTVSGSWYQSYDYVQFSDQYGFSWKNQAASLLWNHLVTPDLSSNFSASYSNNRNLSFEPYGIEAFNLYNGINSIRFKEEFLYSGLSSHSITGGLEFISSDIQPDRYESRGEDSGVIPDQVEKDNAREFGIFLNDEYIVNHLISISAGVRYNLFQQTGPGDTFLYGENNPSSPEQIVDTLFHQPGDVVKSFQTLEPRISLKYSLNPVSSVKFAYNRLNQFIHLLSNSTAAIPVDFWQVSGPYIEPQKADSYSVGYFRNFLNNTWETSFELYYRRIHNLIDFKDFPKLLLNDHIETEILSGTGKSYGGELYIRKRAGKYTGSLSYAYSRTLSKIDGTKPEEIINQGDWFPSKLDRPHNLNIVFNIYVNKSNTFSANFTYLSGRPITAPESQYYQDDITVPYYSERNQFTIPDYHRLDLSYTIKRNIIRKRRYKDSFTFSIYNVYGRKNAYSVYFKKIPGEPASAYKLSIIGTFFPSITYNFEF